MRRSNPPPPNAVPRFFTIKELADLMHWTRQKMRRYLDTNGIEYERSGRTLYVPLSEILTKTPRLWESYKYSQPLERMAAIERKHDA